MSRDPTAASLSPSVGLAWAVLAAVRLASAVVQRASSSAPSQSARRQATLLATGAAARQFTFLILLAVFLHGRGSSFRDLGWGLPAPVRGWIAAAVDALAFVAFLLKGPLRGRTRLGEASAFHFYNSLLAGVAAGFEEEICFRGLVMTRMQQGGGELLRRSLLQRSCLAWRTPPGEAFPASSPCGSSWPRSFQPRSSGRVMRQSISRAIGACCRS